MAEPTRADTPYVLRGGAEGRRRLKLLSEILEPSTLRLLERAGLTRGMACLDLGCGGGDVSFEMARLVGAEGSVVGVDFDESKIAIAREDARALGLANVSFRVLDARRLDETTTYDFAYARFILTYLAERVDVAARVHRALRPGGTIVVEDIDFSGHFCRPECRAFERYVELFREVVRRRGGDADVGPRLPEVLRAAGFENVRLELVQPVFLDGEGKTMARVTMESLSGSLLDEGLATRAEIDDIVAELDAFTRDERTVISLPRIFQVWGERR